MQHNLRRAAKLRGHSFWARGPDNAGHYNSRPHETGFFCDRGDYDGYYGRFFLHWYAQTLIDHADQVLSLANLAFEGTQIIVKVSLNYFGNLITRKLGVSFLYWNLSGTSCLIAYYLDHFEVGGIWVCDLCLHPQIFI